MLENTIKMESRDSSSLLGRYFPFFTTNTELGDSGYIFQVTTPGYNKKTLKPYISLSKVAERTNRKGESDETDVIYLTFPEEFKDGLKNDKGIVDRKKIVWEEQVKRLTGPTTKVVPSETYGKFPLIEYNGSHDTQSQVNLIVNLRNNLRWKTQRISKGNKIDVLWTKNQFAVFEIDGDNESYWLKPIGLYKNNDLMLTKNLLQVELPGFVEEKYARKIGIFLGKIRDLEFASFSRND